MSKSATELMQEALFSAMVETLGALKRHSGGAPNIMLRDLNAIHANSTFTDLPKPVQDALRESVRGTLLAFKKEGYVISPTVTQTRHIASPKRNPSPRASERSR